MRCICMCVDYHLPPGFLPWGPGIGFRRSWPPTKLYVQLMCVYLFLGRDSLGFYQILKWFQDNECRLDGAEYFKTIKHGNRLLPDCQRKYSRVVTNKDKLVNPKADPPHGESPVKTLEKFNTWCNNYGYRNKANNDHYPTWEHSPKSHFLILIIF